MAVSPDLQAHLDTGLTTLCRAWALERRDGVALGFTDHDADLTFEGVTFRADTGLTGAALEQTSGLAVDNAEALGALTGSAVSEADIAAGRYDGAALTAWLVNWQDVAQRHVLFRGTLGEITREGPAFRAELRGLAEALNQPQGQVFQRRCGAVLGDARCGVDLTAPGLTVTAVPLEVHEGRLFLFDAAALAARPEGGFAAGRVQVTGGAASGLEGFVKADSSAGGTRRLELWQA